MSPDLTPSGLNPFESAEKNHHFEDSFDRHFVRGVKQDLKWSTNCFNCTHRLWKLLQLFLLMLLIKNYDGMIIAPGGACKPHAPSSFAKPHDQVGELCTRIQLCNNNESVSCKYSRSCCHWSPALADPSPTLRRRRLVRNSWILPHSFVPMDKTGGKQWSLQAVFGHVGLLACVLLESDTYFTSDGTVGANTFNEMR